MEQAGKHLPWQIVDISLRLVDQMWPFNPSIHFDGQTWRCCIRYCDYALPNGRTIRSPKSRPAGNQTLNAMVEFDPSSWKPIKTFIMNERDSFKRIRSANLGFEDVRIFQTDRGGLQGIGASLHLDRPPAKVPGTQQHQPPEQVLLSFDTDYNIVGAHPIRGDWWSGTPQKNWVPFDGVTEPRFLYSISKGTLFGENGAIVGDAYVTPSAKNFPRAGVESVIATPRSMPTPETPAAQPQAPAQPVAAPTPARRMMPVRGADIQLRGRRSTHDTSVARSTVRTPNNAPMIQTNIGTRIMGTGRALPPRYAGLRGGTQLIRVEEDSWLGLGHEMNFTNGKKFYFHGWYLVDSRGKLKAVSPMMKLSPTTIEFAAGMGIDGDRVVVSFGADDFESKIGVTSLSAVMEMLAKAGKS